MRDTICAAIAERRVLRFSYDGRARLVEPFSYGTSRRGNRVLRAFQTWSDALATTGPGWRLFREEEISLLRVTDEVFDETARPDYHRNDHQLDVLCCV